MKADTPFPLLALSILAAPVAAQVAAEAAPAASLATTIRDVTVYPREALVTRIGRAAVVRGVTKFELTGLSAALNDDSVKVKTGAGATVVGVEVTAGASNASPSKTVEDLRAALRDKMKTLAEMRDGLEVNKSARDFLDAMQKDTAKNFNQSTGTAVDPANYAKTLKFLEDARTANLAAARQMQERIAPVAAEVEELGSKIGRLEAGLRVATKTVKIELQADGSAECDVELSYLVANASWSPQYDVRAGGTLADAVLLMHALVSQRTGEDWSAVNLTFSTAKPEHGATAPKADPMILLDGTRNTELRSVGFTSGRAAKFSRADARLEDKESADAAPVAGAAPEPLRVDAEISDSGLSAQMRVPRPETVPADGAAHRVRVVETKLALAPTHVAVPKKANRVFVEAKPKVASAFPVLAGPAQVFVGNDFVGRIALAETLPGEELKLPLGADPGITIERKQDKANREAPGFLQSRVKWTFGYHITVKNVSAATGKAVVEVTEPIYVSRDDRIRVEIEKSTPEFLRGAKADRERETDGMLTWRIELERGQERTIDLIYNVTAPESLSVAGLER